MRKIKKRNLANSIGVIVDGEDEKWYIEKVKEHYPSKSLREMSVKPEFPQKKKVEDVFVFAEAKIREGYSHVVLILDMDTILKDASEFEVFKKYYAKYIESKNNELTSRQKTKYGWMGQLLLILNTPCLEFWYLLHFDKTTKFFPDYESLKSTLRKKDGFNDYEKREAYYKQTPDIFNRLGGLVGVKKACGNASLFSLEDARSKGVSEMNQFFLFFQNLDKMKE